MKSQRNQMIALVILLVVWAGIWRFYVKLPPSPPAAIKTKAAKAAQQDSLLKTRFHRVRSEIDALYHNRIKPTPFDPRGNPFRIPGAVEGSDSGTADADKAVKTTPGDSAQVSTSPADSGESLLKHAIALMKIGGVVSMNGLVEFTVDGQLHKEGDLFTTKVQSKPVLIRIKELTPFFVVLALDDPEAGGAEIRLRLK